MPAHILQLSDLHLTAEPPNGGEPDPDARLAAVLRAHRASGAPADLIVLSGDVADDGTEAACRRVAAALTPLATPVLAVAGNHDRPESVRAVFGRGAVAEIGAWRVIGVDTSRAGLIHGEIDLPALDRRLDTLDERPTVLVMHHPPVCPPTVPAFRLAGGRALLAALARRPHVRAVLSGHLHSAFVCAAATGPAVYGCPATAVGFRHTGDEVIIGAGSPTGARQLRLADDGAIDTTVLAA